LGLNNITNRAALIGAVANIESSPGNGCIIRVTLNPFEQYIDGHYSDRTG
jgi:signal transduction histidine kinase